MSFENLQPKTINSFEDIRTITKDLPKDPEVLSTLTQEVRDLIDSRGVKLELETYIQALLYDVEIVNKDSARLSAEQRYFLEQVNGMLEGYLDMLEEQ